MNTPPELRRFSDSIASLAATITDLIKLQVQSATPASLQHALAPELKPKPSSEPPTIVQVASYDPVLTKRQLAKHIQVSLRTIDNWLKQGYLPHYRIGKVIRLKLSHIQGEWDAKLKRFALRSR